LLRADIWLVLSTESAVVQSEVKCFGETWLLRC